MCLGNQRQFVRQPNASTTQALTVFTACTSYRCLRGLHGLSRTLILHPVLCKAVFHRATHRVINLSPLPSSTPGLSKPLAAMGPGPDKFFLSKGGTALFAPSPWGALQHLLRFKDPTSGFHSGSTAGQVAASWDGAGKTVVITGASTGLGLEAARVLAARGAHVILGVRDMDKARRNADVIRQRQPGVKLTLLALDLASLASVREFAQAVIGLGDPVNVLMLNAGVAACPWSRSKDGYELQVGSRPGSTLWFGDWGIVGMT